MSVAVIVNKGGGTAAGNDDLRQQLEDAFARHGIEVDLHLVSGDGLVDALEQAAAKRPKMLVAGGGDGTISLAAATAVRSRIPLGILPLGTLNHLARDAGIPNALDAAVDVIATGRQHAIDVAEVNGHIFVNNSGVGLYPLFVRQRESQQNRLRRSKRIAMLVASVRALRHFSRYKLRLQVEGRAAPIRTPLLFIGNNRYDFSLLTLGQRRSLDDGELCVYALLARNRLHLFALAAQGLIGTLSQREDFIALTGLKEVTVDSDRRSLVLSLDGETMQLETPLHFRILPKALQLIVPAAEKKS